MSHTIVSLDGKWAFTYTPGSFGDAPARARTFSASMPVPGCWDDHADELRTQNEWPARRYNEDYQPVSCPMGADPPDASLPHLVGTGWYRRMVAFPGYHRARLRLDAVRMDARVWVNGRPMEERAGPSVPCTFDLDAAWEQDGDNELIVAVSNTRRDRIGCAYRGWKGRSGGLAGPVVLELHGAARIADLFLFASNDLARGHGRCEVDGGGDGAKVAWSLADPASGSILRKGVAVVKNGAASWTFGADGLDPWSDRTPRLYRLRADVRDGRRILDRREQAFGLRRLCPDGTGLRLNGRPIFLRGLTEHAYFPVTCIPPWEFRYWREALRRFRALGFNWIRFHTWVPPGACLRAADETGMLVQVEPPQGSERTEWEEILRACRIHPSVVIYCAGNEECLDESRIEELKAWAARCRALAPDALFNPQEGLRGVEYGWKEENLGAPEDGMVREPYPHNPRRLKRLRAFSDVFGQYTWGRLSYTSIDGNADDIDERLEAYKRPCLAHEVCLHGSYLDLGLSSRYRSTRIGTALFDAVAGHLQARGLLDRAPRYFENSCAWMRLARKHCLETARRCRRLAGYDLLGAVDTHWHRTGYPCGLMNEFLELKPGETERDVLRYNGESVLLLDVPRLRNLRPGQRLAMDLWVSHFGPSDEKAAAWRWSLRDQAGTRFAGGNGRATAVRTGVLRRLGRIAFQAPPAEHAAELTLRVRLDSPGLDIENEWSFWIFPERDSVFPVDGSDDILCRFGKRYLRVPRGGRLPVRLSTRLDGEERTLLARGGRVLCLGSGGLPTRQTSFQPSIAGRTSGHLATVIRDHDVTRRFPHRGFCDWSFFHMLHHGRAMVWENAALPFDPILEIAGSFKDARPEACLAEFRVDTGRLLLCTLHLDPADPGAMHLLDLMVAYLDRAGDEPAPSWPLDRIPLPLPEEGEDERSPGTDMGFDARAQVPPP